MAGTPPPVPFDWDAAHQAGLSDASIIDSLRRSGKINDWDVTGALSAGVTPSQLVQAMGGTPQESGVIDSAREGVAAPFLGVAKTLETHIGKNAVSDVINKGANAVGPATYNAAPLYDKQGFHAGNIPSWLAANVPSMGVALTAAKATPGPWWAKALGGAAAGFLMNAGNEDQQAAANRTGKSNTTPSWGDVARGDVTSAVSNAVNALPFTRYFPAANALDKVGVKGVGQALGRYIKTIGAQGLASGASNAVEQAGQSVGTPNGVQVNPTELTNATAGGALSGAYFGARPTLRNALDANAFSDVTNDPKLREAATQVANQIKSNTPEDASLNAGVVFSGKAQKAGAVALKKTQINVHSNLDDAISAVKSSVTLPTAAKNVLTGIKEGSVPSPEDYDTLQTALDNTNYRQAPQLMNAVRQAHALQALSEVGHVVEGKFKGGIEGVASHILTGENIGKSAIVGAAAGLGENAGHIIAYSPHVIGGFAGLTALARLMDNITGAHAPAGRIVRNFANPNVPNAYIPQSAGPASASVPSISPTGQPWGPVGPALPPPINPLRLPANIKSPVRNLMRVTQPQGPVMQVPRPGFAPPVGWVPPNVMASASVPPMRGFVPPRTAAPMSNDALGRMNGFTTPEDDVVNGSKMQREALQNVINKVKAPQVGEAFNGLPINIVKANGGTSINGEDFPRSSYAHLDPRAAAEAVYRVNQASVNHPEGYKNSTANRITKERAIMAQIGTEVPGLPVADLTARLEYAPDQTRAKAFREWVKKSYPQAAGALNAYLSDAMIESLWNRKGK